MYTGRNYSTTIQLYRRDTTTSWDPFATNPVRRSFASFVVCAAAFILPMTVLPANLEALTMVTFGWMAAIGMVLSLPILFISLIELGWSEVSRRLYPSVDVLDLSPRVRNLLRRYGYQTVASVEGTSDDAFLMLSNFDPKALHELRRAVSIWQYRRWQDAGFPANWG